MRMILFVIAAALASAQSRPIVIKAARMFDGVSDRVVTPGLVVLGEKIRGVGANAEIPAGSEVIDLGDATILPGFMDAHTHLTMAYELDFRKQQMDTLTKTVAEQALDASVNARVTLMAGFTTVRDVGSTDFLDVGLRNAIASGKVPWAADAGCGERHRRDGRALRQRRGLQIRAVWAGIGHSGWSGERPRPDALGSAVQHQIWRGRDQDVRYRRSAVADRRRRYAAVDAGRAGCDGRRSARLAP
jgi:imidazolonepropionase-like amidohydrolase